MAPRPLGEQIGRMLADRGVDTVFGIPGVHNIEMYRGLESGGLRHVLARHEQGAGFMADGYARATGRPGVAFVITGPGLTNIMTPMGQAYSDSVPLLVFSSCLDETAGPRGQLHQMRDQRGAASCVCDWSEEARSPEAAYRLLDRALTEFKLARPRPKHIQIPISLLAAPAADFGPAPGPWADRAIHMQGMIEPILRAKYPLFILGGGAVHCGYPANEAMKKLKAAAFETYAGRGVAGAHALNFGSFLARPGSAQIIGQADVVVLVGTELSETDTWRDDPGIRGTCIQVDIDPANFRPEATFALHCRAEEFFERLLEMLDGHQPIAEWDADRVRAARRRWRAEVHAERPGIVPVADALRKSLPDLTLIYSDMTQFAYAAKEVWPMKRPGFWHHPTGFGTLGYALPAAIGGKVARPDLPVVAIAGDYGFQYTMQELGTAAELGLPLPILLWDNAALGEIEAAMTGAQIAPVAVRARNPDFGKLAAAYGLGYARPGGLAELQNAVAEALNANRPALIHMTPEMSGGR